MYVHRATKTGETTRNLGFGSGLQGQNKFILFYRCKRIWNLFENVNNYVLNYKSYNVVVNSA